MTKTLVIYCSHLLNDSVKFFIKNGLFQSDQVDFHLCFNNDKIDVKDLLPKYTNIHITYRENYAGDFGAFSQILLDQDLYKNYDYFVLINASCMGPFVPLYIKDKWVDLVIAAIDDKTKLIGASINDCFGNAHVQTYFMATDKIGMGIGIKHQIFSNELAHRAPGKELVNMWGWLVHHCEIRYSRAIIQEGYNIGCFMKGIEGEDYTKIKTPFVERSFGTTNNDQIYNGSYFGTTVHPYEVMFFKSNRGITPAILNAHMNFHNEISN